MRRDAEPAGAGSLLGGQLAHRGSAGPVIGPEIGAGEPLAPRLPRGSPGRARSDPNDTGRIAPGADGALAGRWLAGGGSVPDWTLSGSGAGWAAPGALRWGLVRAGPVCGAGRSLCDYVGSGLPWPRCADPAGLARHYADHDGEPGMQVRPLAFSTAVQIVLKGSVQELGSFVKPQMQLVRQPPWPVGLPLGAEQSELLFCGRDRVDHRALAALHFGELCQ